MVEKELEKLYAVRKQNKTKHFNDLTYAFTPGYSKLTPEVRKLLRAANDFQD